jgi:hypothetical protein
MTAMRAPRGHGDVIVNLPRAMLARAGVPSRSGLDCRPRSSGQRETEIVVEDIAYSSWIARPSSLAPNGGLFIG